jgi:hypothetical protein
MPDSPPEELIDPDGEGIYMLDSVERFGWPVLEAARRLGVFDDNGRLDWRGVDMEVVFMEPSEDGETWVRAKSGWPRYWRLNLPRRWAPVAYVYCTPRPE